MEPKRKTLKLSNKISELETIQLCLDELVEKWNVPAALDTLNLMRLKRLTNVVNYAYGMIVMNIASKLFLKCRIKSFP